MVTASKDTPDSVVNKPLSPVDAARAQAAAASAAESPMSIDMYCAARGKPARHAAGLSAYTRVRYATPSQWDQIFLAY